MICLDFDGVLFDTAREAYLIAHKSFFNDDNVEYSSKRYAKFLILRPFVVSPWQYLLVFDLISENLTDQVILEKYKQQYKFQPSTKELDFEYKFIKTRNEMMNGNRTNWLKLQKPYSFFRLIKPLLIKQPQYFQIVSTKQTEYILELLNHHGVHWKAVQVWGGDVFEECERSKAIILKRFIQNNVRVIFVDDNSKHLNELNSLKNVEAISANWGYTGIDDAEDNTKIVINKITNFLRDL